MFPIANTLAISSPPPASLVATNVPGNQVVRVPIDNVAPSVSSVQINNNARSNGGGFAPIIVDAPELSTGTPSLALSLPAFLSSASASLGANAQTSFLTQLLAQQAPNATPVFLPQYEELVALSLVKYRPSNAGLPQNEPASAFGKLLQEANVTQTAQIAAKTSAALVAANSNQAPQLSATVGIPQVKPTGQSAGKPQAADTAPGDAPEETDSKALTARAASIAYAAAANRTLRQGNSFITDSI